MKTANEVGYILFGTVIFLMGFGAVAKGSVAGGLFLLMCAVRLIFEKGGNIDVTQNSDKSN